VHSKNFGKRTQRGIANPFITREQTKEIRQKSKTIDMGIHRRVNTTRKKWEAMNLLFLFDTSVSLVTRDYHSVITFVWLEGKLLDWI